MILTVVNAIYAIVQKKHEKKSGLDKRGLIPRRRDKDAGAML